MIHIVMITECEDNLSTACEQTCNNLFADLLQAVRFYACSLKLTFFHVLMVPG